MPGSELPLVIDEIPILAMLAAFAAGGSRFEGAGELRVKESDRLAGIVRGIRALGGDAALEGDSLVVSGDGLQLVPPGESRSATFAITVERT